MEWAINLSSAVLLIVNSYVAFKYGKIVFVQPFPHQQDTT